MPFKNHPVVVPQVKNRILLALPKQEFQRILPHLSHVGLHLGQVLYNAEGSINHVYFMNSGMTSLLAVTDDGKTVELGAVGSEGILGVRAALDGDRIFYSGVVQIPGSSMRIRSDILRYEFKHCVELSRLLRDYMLSLRLQTSQIIFCNHSHSLEQRLCRWLLTSQDCARSDWFPVIHESLSHLVGAFRAPVTLAAQALQDAGLISYRRKGIRILERQKVEARACECYRIMTDRYDRLSAA
jgi:CRP-like cAMP-binding protein